MPSHRERQTKRPAVPKFTSFKPKAETPNPLVVGTGPESERPGDGRAKPEHVRDRRTSAPRTSASTSHSNTATRLDISSRSSNPYVVDRNGDPLIRRYGTNDRRRIPEYRRFGSGRILGIHGFMRIDHSKNQDEFFLHRSSEAGSLLSRDKKTLLAKGTSPASLAVRIRAQPDQVLPSDSREADYLPLQSSRKRRRTDSVSEDSSNDEGEPSYRSIHGKSRAGEGSDNNEQYESDDPEHQSGFLVDDPVTVRSMELSRQTREHPDDIEAWLQLVDYQDVILESSSNSRGAITPAERKSFADIKLSMLEKAHSNAKSENDRERLQLRILQEGGNIWDSKKLGSRWTESMRTHGSSFRVWLAYVDFRQTDLASFRFEDIKQLYVDRLHATQNSLRISQDPGEQLELCEEVVYIFTRATRFFSDAGYKELATAAWQAALELTFHRLDPADSESHSMPPSFQDFWENETPRIGEEGALGWGYAVSHPESQEPPEPRTFHAPGLPDTRDGYRAWAAVEQGSALNSDMPARMMDTGMADDPFRVVMFADIENIVPYFPGHSLHTAQKQLAAAYLMFCRMPPLYEPSGRMRGMQDDRFVKRLPDSGLSLLGHESSTTDAENLAAFKPSYQRMKKTTDTLFSNAHWPCYVPNIERSASPSQYSWVYNSLRHLVRTGLVKDLAPYSLAFGFANQPGGEKKTAKALIRQDGNNVDLYEGYAMIEQAKGNKESAQTVLLTAMALSSIPEHDRVRLGISWAWMELEDDYPSRSLARLCSLAENDTEVSALSESTAPGVPQILKTRQSLCFKRDYLLSSGDVDNAVVYAEGFALVEYLSQRSGKEPGSETGGDIWSAMSAYSSFSHDLNARVLHQAPGHERLLQSAARLLYLHARKGPYRPSFMREQLATYIRLFPRNTLFLSLFAWRESRLSIDDKVRAILKDTVLKPPHSCLETRLFAIQHEMRTGNAHSTSAAFERAVEDEAGKNHAELWILYIRFCHGKKELKSKAKSLFYRAMQQCPWSKDLGMEAFVTLVRVMDSSELRSVFNTMCDNGLRIHVEMGEFVEKWREKRRT